MLSESVDGISWACRRDERNICESALRIRRRNHLSEMREKASTESFHVTMSYTPQQQAIVDVDLASNDVVVVSARAGTGKTHTLKGLSNRSTKSYVYITFNVSMAESSPIQPASTLDALVLELYERDHGKVEIVDVLEISHPDAALVRATIHNWCCSADAELSEHHVPASNKALKDIAVAVVSQSLCAKKMTHTLLQVYAPPIPYHTILVDEAQDLNSRQLDYLLRHGGPRVFIGDPHQSIYSFRGTSGCMDALVECATKRFELTHSFRFGPEIANVANAVLCLKNVEGDVVGVGKTSRVLKNDVDVVPDAILARTKLGLFRALIQFHTRHRIDYVVFGRCKDTFERWLKLASTDTSGCSKYDARALRLIPRDGGVLVKSLKNHLSTRGVVFCTAHHSKGLEFDVVSLAEDFRGVVQRVAPACESKTSAMYAKRSNMEELNINYVAITRARKTLLVNTTINSLIQ